jgi:hypothetical protein
VEVNRISTNAQVALDEENGDLMSFMRRIEDSYRQPLDQLAIDFLQTRSGLPSLDFCKRCSGLQEPDDKIAARLGVAISTVRGWRAIGKRV